MPAVQQAVTFVTRGGTPIILSNQRGAPYPTTGYGALVFANGATLDNVTLNNPVFTGQILGPGSVWNGEIIGVLYGGTGVNGFGKITNYTTDHTITADQSHQYFTNTGAAGPVTLTMPNPVAELEYTFICAEAQTLTLDVGGSVVVGLGEIVTTPGGAVSSDTPYSSITLKALSSTLWVATSLLGSWAPV